MAVLWLLMLSAMMLCPVTASICAEMHGEVRVSVMVKYLILHKELQYALNPGAGGFTLEDEQTGKRRSLLPGRRTSGRLRMAAGAFLHSRAARHWLLRTLKLRRLDGDIRVHTDDAARTALLTGLIRTGLTLLPPSSADQVHLSVMPDFCREHSAVRLRCIVSIRLGNLFLTLLMLLPALLPGSHQPAKEAA